MKPHSMILAMFVAFTMMLLPTPSFARYSGLNCVYDNNGRTICASGASREAVSHHRQSRHVAAKTRPVTDANANRVGVDHRASALSKIRSAFLPHPSGCPRIAFCACGAAVEIFGYAKRSLWLAAAWFRFPRAEPAPGMVAVRQHHVFVLRQHLRGREWLVADYNSGGHLSRLHAQSIAGYVIVNPRGGKLASLR